MTREAGWRVPIATDQIIEPLPEGDHGRAAEAEPVGYGHLGLMVRDDGRIRKVRDQVVMMEGRNGDDKLDRTLVTGEQDGWGKGRGIKDKEMSAGYPDVEVLTAQAHGVYLRAEGYSGRTKPMQIMTGDPIKPCLYMYQNKNCDPSFGSHEICSRYYFIKDTGLGLRLQHIYMLELGLGLGFGKVFGQG